MWVWILIRVSSARADGVFALHPAVNRDEPLLVQERTRRLTHEPAIVHAGFNGSFGCILVILWRRRSANELRNTSELRSGSTGRWRSWPVTGDEERLACALRIFADHVYVKTKEASP